MFRFQRDDAITSDFVRHVADGFERVPEVRFALLVHLRLSCLIDQQIARLGAAKQLGHTGIALGRIPKP